MAARILHLSNYTRYSHEYGKKIVELLEKLSEIWPNDNFWPRVGTGEEGQNFKKSNHLVYECPLA